MIATFGKKFDFDFKVSLVEKLSRVITMSGTLGLVMETLGWTRWHRLTAWIKLN